MSVERTLSIIKPDVTRRNLIGKVNSMIEEAGLKIVGCKMIHMDENMAQSFYAEHSERPFFASLVEYMQSGPVVVQVLEGENAINKYRDVMGATNPSDATPGTIRAEVAESIEANSVHGSDSADSAKREVSFFFTDSEIVTN